MFKGISNRRIISGLACLGLAIIVIYTIQRFHRDVVSIFEHPSEIINSNKQEKLTLRYFNDTSWEYELVDTKTNIKRNLASCEADGSVQYKLLRWKDNRNFVVLVEKRTSEKPQEIVVNTLFPKIPCDIAQFYLNNMGKSELGRVTN